jgi:hypothetical protein
VIDVGNLLPTLSFLKAVLLSGKEQRSVITLAVLRRSEPFGT